MKDLVLKWRELSDENFCDETMADAMDMDACADAHSIKGEVYKQCADELEAALKSAELAQLSHNNSRNVICPKCGTDNSRVEELIVRNCQMCGLSWAGKRTPVA